MVQRELFHKKVTREDLNSLVDRAADLIRTAIDYKFILVLLGIDQVDALRIDGQKLSDSYSGPEEQGYCQLIP